MRCVKLWATMGVSRWSVAVCEARVDLANDQRLSANDWLCKESM